MELTYGTSQLYTSARMRRQPVVARLVSKIFGYTNIGNYARSKIFKKLVEKLPLNTFHSIMDLGSGRGEFTCMLAPALKNATITALDVSEDNLNLVKTAVEGQGIKNVETHLGTTDTLEKNDFDFIYSVDVFEHILKEDMPFKACHERLKKGGYLMVKMPNIKQRTIFPGRWFDQHNQWLEDEHIGQVYDLEGLKERFRKENFSITYASYSDGLLARLGWEIGYLSKKAGVVTQLLFLPLAKLFVNMDLLFRTGRRGNAIQVIGKKIGK